MVLFFAHIPFVVNRAFSATPAERLQQFRLFLITASSASALAVAFFSLARTPLICTLQHSQVNLITSYPDYFEKKKKTYT